MSSELLLSERMHDVVLKVHHGGYSWRLPAHSLVLASRSSALREMIEEMPREDLPVTLTVTGMRPQTASALVLELSRRVLLHLLRSDKLNVPDESVVFWGLWRWGRQNCAKVGKSLEDESVAAYLDDLVVLIRQSSLRRRDRIPAMVLERFSTCLCRRSKYDPPRDSLRRAAAALRTCASWEEVALGAGGGGDGALCLQVSFDGDVVLLGVALEMCCEAEKPDCYIRVFEERARKEVLRQPVAVTRSSSRRLSRSGEAERWCESDLLLREPLFLTQGSLSSIYIVCNSSCTLPSSPASPRTRYVGATRATFHGQVVVAVKELYLVPDVSVSWGP